jgi:hypothetical protein
VQGRFEELDGYALDARARDVLAGLSFSQDRMATSACSPPAGSRRPMRATRNQKFRPAGGLPFSIARNWQANYYLTRCSATARARPRAAVTRGLVPRALLRIA